MLEGFFIAGEKKKSPRNLGPGALGFRGESFHFNADSTQF